MALGYMYRNEEAVFILPAKTMFTNLEEMIPNPPNRANQVELMIKLLDIIQVTWDRMRLILLGQSPKNWY